MLKHHLLIAWRNLRRNKWHSFINIAGLSIGMAIALLIGLWVTDELSFNKQFKGYDRIAEVMRDLHYNGTRMAFSGAPYEMESELRTNYGEYFSHVVLATYTDNHVLVTGDKSFRVKGRYMGEEVPQLLSMHLLEGDPKGLHDRSSIFLSASTARALFGSQDALGKTLRMDSSELLQVTGVYEDLPRSSDFSDLAFIAPLNLFVASTPAIRTTPSPWRFLNLFYVYVQLKEGVDWKTVNEKIRMIRRDKMDAQSFNADKVYQFLYPMTRWHLYDALPTVGSRERVQYVRLLSLIGVFVLLLACINFVNLSTARSELRAKEVGIRKTIGSGRRSITVQFFGESLLAVGCSLVLCLLWVPWLLPLFNNLSGKHLSILWGNPWFWGWVVLFGAVTGVIAGIYPALYLSSFRPVKVLKGTFKAGPAASLSRRVLVILQFTVSIALIIGTVTIYRQIRFAQGRPIGYDKTGLVVVTLTPAIEKHFESLRQELKTQGLVTDAALAVNTPTDLNADDVQFDWQGKDPNSTQTINIGSVTPDYGKVIGWELVSGRDFSAALPTDSSAFILTESAVRLMGFQHPVGQTVKWHGMPYRVIGVVKDMIVQSPYQAPGPCIFHISGRQVNWAVVLRVNPSLSMTTAMAGIGTVYSHYDPTYPMEYRFVDQEYAKKFGDEVRIGELSLLFTIFAISICCLGLLGMASFMAEQRRREIGIRKVLGASVFAVWQLLSREFMALVFIALVIATPLAWLGMERWLEQYPYRTNMTWWVFVAAGAGALLITVATVSYQTVKAALTNPVKTLRDQ